MRVDRVEIVPATLDDVYPFFGKLPPYRLKAYAGRLGDEVLGIGGLYFLPDGTRVGFLALSEEASKYPLSLYKATKKFLAQMIAEGVPSIRAVADPAIEPAVRFLLHFGFKPVPTKDTTVYVWHAPTQS